MRRAVVGALLAALISERGAGDGREAGWLDARDVLRVEPGNWGW